MLRQEWRCPIAGVRLPPLSVSSSRMIRGERGKFIPAKTLVRIPEGIPAAWRRFSTRMRGESIRCGRVASRLFLAAVTSGALAAQQPETQPTPVVRSPGNAQWAANPKEARSRAASERKFVYYEFDRPKCGPCARMDSLLYPAFDFEALLAQMVPVKVSLDSAEGKQLEQRYNVSDVPSVLVTTPEGRMVFQMVGFSSNDDFYPHIRSDLDSYRKFARRIDAQDVTKLSAREALETGAELYQRVDPAAALPRLRRAVAAPDTTALIRED